ncbi:MAG: trehalose-phosphatase [Candidatus Binatia bacterium]|nr:trehalose-phosphatase [Candidatus Binatia bacterium]
MTETQPHPDTVSALPSALERMEEIVQRAAEKQLVLFLDYDGTLTPIVERPELALLSPETRTLLSELARRWTVVIMSGRDLHDLRQRVGLPGLFYAGSHGFDILGPDGHHHQQGREFIPTLDRIERYLRKRLATIQGALIERKAFSLAVHYRLAQDSDVPLIAHIVDDVLEREPALRKLCGKKVYELQPDVDWNKGKAVLWLLEALHLTGADVLPLYLGDDMTDWDAFAVLHGRGIAILVHETPQPCAAHYALKDPAEVHSFLAGLLACLPRDKTEAGGEKPSGL